MCTLYKVRTTVEEIARTFGGLANPRINLPAFDEIYPNYEAPVLRQAEPGAALSLEVMRWGMPPFGKVKRPIVNVRNLESNFWKNMLADPARRCLVPVTEFCEWTGEKGSKRKVWFGLEQRKLFAFAGIWRPVSPEDEGGEPSAHMAFLTCAPNETVGRVHPKAMPVILAEADHASWLESDYAGACALATAYPDAEMVVEGE